MIKSAITVSLVPALRGGPWVLWDDLSTSCQKAANLGFDAVELFTPGPEADGLEEALSENNLELAAVGTGAGKVVHGLTLTDPDSSVRASAIKFIKSMIDFGAQYKAPAIIGSMQGMHGGDRDEALRHLAEGLEILGSHATLKGVKLIYEPLNRYETNLFNRLEDGAEFLDGLTTDGVVLLADLFHMNIEEVNIAEALQSAARHVGHVHFADSNRRPIGNGHLDVAPVAKALQNIGYDRYVSAEAFDWPNPDDAAQQTISSFRRFFR